jgi:hypothetical protein
LVTAAAAAVVVGPERLVGLEGWVGAQSRQVLLTEGRLLLLLLLLLLLVVVVGFG